MSELFLLTATVIAALYFTRIALVDFLTNKDFKGDAE